MKQSTSFAQVATNLLNVLQGYTKGIRFLLVMFVALSVSVSAWGAEEIVATFSSNEVVTNSGYTVYESNDWYLSKGGNQVSGGYNAKNITKIGDAFGTSANTSDNGFYIESKTTLSNVSKITFTYTAGSGYSGAKIYLGYSTNGSNWNAVSLTSGTQGMSANDINTTYTMQFAAIPSAYYAIIVSNGTTTGAFRLDNITATFYGTSGGETPEPCTDPTIEWNTIPANGEVGGSMTASVTTNYSNGLTYSSSNQTVATVTNAGVINYLSAGTTTITATVTGDGTTICEGPVSVQQEITVTAPAGGGGDDDSDTWTLVKDVNDLAVGDEIVIAASGSDYALSTTQNGNNRGRAAVTKNGETITFGNDVQVLTLQTGNVSNSFAFYTGNGYLYAASSSSNYLRTETNLSNNSSWSIAITNAGVATITAQGTNTNNLLRYNSSSSIFSCYSSGQLDVSIYKKAGGATTYTITSTLSHVTAAGGNPTTITSEDTELELSYSADTDWNLPENITITMGGNELTDSEYVWDNENGDLLILPTSGFTGDIVVTINGWQQLAAPTGLNVANITSSGATLSWDAVANASSYTVSVYGENDEVIEEYPGLTETTKNVDGLSTETNYIFGVVAVGDGITYTNSIQAVSDVFTTASAICTVTYDANGGEGTITDETEYTNGATVTVLGNFGKLTKDGYAFTGWNTEADGSGDSYKHNDQFAIKANTPLYAQWCEAYWKLVTDAAELENDTRIVIAAKDYNFALSTTQTTSNRGQAEITKKYNTITFGADVQTLSVVGPVNNNFALYSPGPLSTGYLYAASNSANQLKTKTIPDNNCYWSIAISQGTATATILAQGTYTNNQLKYNAGSDLFSCYGSGNSQKDVVIYKEVCVQDQYNVTSNLTNATANTNPITVDADATSLTLNYSANTGYLLPETITVKMGGVELLSGTNYNWNKETGTLTITVTGFYGDIDVTIEAEEDPCYGFAMSEVTATSTTNSITLSWTAVEGATSYNVTLNPGDFSVSTGNTSHTFEELSPKTTYNWEVQAVKGTCQASQTGSIATQKERFTVSWIVNGNTESPYATESVVDGESITQYPSAPSAPSGCREKVFIGWTDNPINTPTNEAPAILYKQKSDVPAITANTTLHAVWADVIGGGETTKSLLNAEIKSFHQQGVTTSYSDLTVPSTDGDWSGLFCTANSNSVYTINLKKDLVNENRPYLKSSEFNNITKVSIIATHTSTKGNRTLYLCNAATNSPESNNIGTISIAKDNNSSQLCTLSSSATTLYLYVDNGIQIKTITLTTGGTTTTAYTTLCDECTPSTLTLETDNTTADLDINGEATITFSTTGGNGGEITYAANPKTGVTWENGTATFTKAGDYTITASQEENGEYCPTTSNTVNVTITAIPHLYFVTEPANPIVFDPVECGGNTRLDDKKSVSVQAYNLAAAVTAQVTGPYKIARTSGATLNEYDTKLTLDKNQEGHINGNYDDVYILSFPPAGSSEPTEGTLTFTTTNGNELTVSLSTPTITCTPCTLTFNDRGIKTTQEYYAGTEVPEPATPTGVCGEYEFDGWALAKVESGSTTYAKVEFPYIMPANNQTVLYAVYRYTEGPTNQYELVTEIESGKDYVIAAYDEQNGDFALTNSESSTNGKFASVKVECDVNNIITTDNADIIWTVTGNDEDGYEFYNSAVQKYIEMYRYDGKSLLRLVDNCTNTFDVNIEMDENDKVYVDITSPEVDATYNVFSFYEQLFNVYKSCDYNIYFYEQTATSLYTTTPDCHPSVTLTSDGEVYVTATNGRGIMATTPLTLTTTDLAPNTEIAISSNSSDIYFSTERNTNFAMAQASQPKTLLTLTTNEGGELEKQLYIHYKPNADGDGTPAEVVVTADVSTHNPPFTAQKTIHVRNLPAKFVIATKAGATWYALPANMNDATNPAAVVIEVDETTMTATAPNTIPYTLFPVKTTNGSGDRYTQYGDRVRFSAINYEYRGLWANNNATEQTIRNVAVIDAIGDDGEAAYEWKVATTVVDGNWQYTLYSDQGNNKNHLCYSMNQENPAWGTYASNEAQYQLYFLPIKAETTPFDYQVVEWYPNKLLIHTTTAFSSLTAKIAGEQVDKVKYTSKDANQYEVTGLPLMKNPAKALTLEFVVADATYTGIHTIPVMLSGGDHSISTLAIDKGIYNYTDLVVRDGATLTIDGDTKADNTFYDVTIYPTAKISVPEGKQLSVHRMTFLGGISEIYNGSTYTTNKYGIPQLSLMGTLGKTVTTMDYIMRVNLDQMYQVGVPYDVALEDIKYWDGSAITPGTQLYVSTYDGQARANLDMNNTWRWEVNFAEKVLKAGIGYTISAEPQVAGDAYSILRMPMKSNISSGETEASKQVPVIAYANQHSVQIADNHKGWNYLSNPYMTAISGGDADSKILLGSLQYTDGSWELVNTEYRYVTIPYNDGEDYYQRKFSEATLLPFKSFFLQIAENGDLSFDLVSRQAAPARYLQQAVDSREVEFEILLANATRSDNMGLLISEEYTPDYEINADLEKMIGSMSVYSIYNGYNLAYNAINPTNAQDWIPIGYSVPDVGEYTFSLDEDVDLESVEHIYLIDYETSEMTDLVEYEYTFQTSEKKNDARFAIQVRLSQKHDDTTTVLDNLNATDNKSSKFIYNEQLYILRNGNIYDATGQFVTTINK